MRQSRALWAFLLSLTLVVQAIAGALCPMRCSATPDVARAVSVAVVDCCHPAPVVKSKAHHAPAKRDCCCKTLSTPDTHPSALQDALVISGGLDLVAVLPSIESVDSVRLYLGQPGIVGFDSGPPPDGCVIRSSARAPPIV